ncbi:T9SS type A sorting domain-containing protein [Mariniflexile litorale]|uniref:T9SS type A sorting domain-containing protein n=1 Tax=Mariniflexile litorale TaxID=3045158 RepID=A0AAU7EHA5_9FLAO|nr:T9SS type A sorting domain-containing protein [Mariniflexile sp. KMM 9835]MDQ8212001.1 T9SS type A sorting domain-containing protein [Mariniflexile sp. KMM 9835]
MNLIIKLFASALILCYFLNSSAQEWELVKGLPQIEFSSIISSNNKIYAASQNNLYVSSDGVNWQVQQIHPISILPTCMIIVNNLLYVGTMENGVYYKTLATESSWSHALLGLQISSFEMHDGSLHVSSLGSGVWKNVLGTWNNMTFNLATYSYNVSKIKSIDGTLFAFAGSNGTFYKFNSNTNNWKEYFYGATYAPGLTINDALFTNNTILLSNGNRLLRSDDSGASWHNDNSQLTNGIHRFLFKGGSFNYAATILGDYNTTQLHKRTNNAKSQSSWGDNTETLPFIFYEITEFNQKMYIASNLGIFVKSNNVLDTDDPTKIPLKTKIFPSPSSNGRFTVLCEEKIDNLEIFDLNGKKIVSKKECNNKREFITIPTKGVYLVKTKTQDKSDVKKIIIQ